MAVFHPFLDARHRRFPEQKPEDYRIVGYIGSVGGDQLVPGPALDTDKLSDVHEVLLLLALSYDGMQQLRRTDGEVSRFALIGFEPVLAVTREIVFAVDAVA